MRLSKWVVKLFRWIWSSCKQGTDAYQALRAKADKFSFTCVRRSEQGRKPQRGAPVIKTVGMAIALKKYTFAYTGDGVVVIITISCTKRVLTLLPLVGINSV